VPHHHRARHYLCCTAACVCPWVPLPTPGTWWGGRRQPALMYPPPAQRQAQRPGRANLEITTGGHAQGAQRGGGGGALKSDWAPGVGEPTGGRKGGKAANKPSSRPTAPGAPVPDAPAVWAATPSQSPPAPAHALTPLRRARVRAFETKGLHSKRGGGPPRALWGGGRRFGGATADQVGTPGPPAPQNTAPSACRPLRARRRRRCGSRAGGVRFEVQRRGKSRQPAAANPFQWSPEGHIHTGSCRGPSANAPVGGAPRAQIRAPSWWLASETGAAR